jgi:hypothetical protein
MFLIRDVLDPYAYALRFEFPNSISIHLPKPLHPPA